MLRGIRPYLSFANVVSVTALFIALGGVSYAAIKLPKNSVGNAQIKKNAVTGSKVKNSSLTGSDVKNSSLTGSDVKDGSLTTADFRGSVQGPQGPAGPQGAKGDTGAKGDPGSAGATSVVVRRKSLGALAANTFTNDFALCQAGERATGGGGGFQGNGGNEIIQQSYPILANGAAAQDGETPVGWRVFIKNANASPLPDTYIYVVCASP